jgi:DNA modification methylase/transcription elongation factor Elf1
MPESTKIICLGKEFNSEEERREYFRNELRAKLPELKKIEGFPIGEDDDIINLSDPPYYTACPNPWLNDFVDEWEKEKEHIRDRKKDFHVDEPYASDISVGKNNPIYNAHTYHTKVPHPAIMRYLLNFTEPGDIVLDGFAGTGMTGVAAQMCGHPTPESKYSIESEFKSLGLKMPTWGTRKAICGDLSPVASFIDYNYNTPIEIEDFQDEIDNIISDVEDECGWMYQTNHSDGRVGKINYTVWSEVFTCPNCNSEIVFYDVAIDVNTSSVKDEFICNNCRKIQTKSSVEKTFVTIYDRSINKTIRQIKTVPVLISYIIGTKKYFKRPDKKDHEVITKIDETSIPYWFPNDRMPEGGESRRNDDGGFTHAHHFYTKRNLWLLSALRNRIGNSLRHLLVLNSISQTLCSKLVRYNLGNRGNGTLSGTLYMPSLIAEANVLKVFNGKSDDFKRAYNLLVSHNLVYTNSATNIKYLKDCSIDYIFTDPPFGANIMYSELNYLWEAWLKVKTNIHKEAIENKILGKSLLDYQVLMAECFFEYYRLLKPGRWMTVEFSNTSAAVWNGIQIALQKAGFIIANISALDKQQGSFKAVNTVTAVKQDLVISCYKPTSAFESTFKSEQENVTVWDFVREHLIHLPNHVKKGNSTTTVIERSPKILYDRLITFYLMKGLPVPIDAKDFQEGLKQRFIERDGMYFTAEQATEYDEKKAKAPQFVQLSLIVTNESDAIEWLKDRLRKQAQKYQDIMPDFRIATQSLRKGDTLPELQDILNENFIQEADGRWRTPDPNEAKDREALRTKVLLKEFNGYVNAITQPRAKKLKEVRVEALRAGFKNCWEQKDFKTIVNLGDMIPQNILLEDEQLLMYYDIAKDRV